MVFFVIYRIDDFGSFKPLLNKLGRVRHFMHHADAHAYAGRALNCEYVVRPAQ